MTAKPMADETVGRSDVGVPRYGSSPEVPRTTEELLAEARERLDRLEDRVSRLEASAGIG